MLPKTLALVDDDVEFADFLALFLEGQGVSVKVFRDSDELLVDRTPYDFNFYVLDLSLPGIDGVELIRILRKRTNSGILVVSGRLDADAFDKVLSAGADMFLSKPVRFEQVVLAVKTVNRRSASELGKAQNWRLDKSRSELIAPDAIRITLSETDLTVMQCFLDANGAIVPQELLRTRLSKCKPPGTPEPDNLLHATIYRLRRRIEKSTPTIVPLQSQSRIGYVFKAPLTAA